MVASPFYALFYAKIAHFVNCVWDINKMSSFKEYSQVQPFLVIFLVVVITINSHP